jgi:hypothetical protein
MSSVLLQSLVPGTLLEQIPGNVAVLGNGRDVFVFEQGSYATGNPVQVAVFADEPLTIPMSQPLLAGQGAPGAVPGYVQAGVPIEFFDPLSGTVLPAEPLKVADLIGTDGLIGGPGSLGLAGGGAGGGGGGGVASVTAGNSTITIGGTAGAPTVAVTPGTFDAAGAASSALSTAEGLIAQSASVTATATQAFTAPVTAPWLQATGLPGATAASRYVGATVSAPPTSGTFATGDLVTLQSGAVAVCVAGGSPGTWVQIGQGSQTAHLTATQTTTSTTLLNVPGFAFTAAAGANYIFEFGLYVSYAANVALAGPGTPQTLIFATAGQLPVTAYKTSVSADAPSGGGFYLFRGFLANGTTGGAVQLQYSANAGEVSVLAGSYMTAMLSS